MVLRKSKDFIYAFFLVFWILFQRIYMENSVLNTVVLPISLIIIMLGMGLSLTLDDFRRLGKNPKPIIIGLISQLILLPLIGFLLIKVFNLTPEFSVGLMILAACPGGVTSNLITHVAKGDIALSVSLTAIASFLTVFSIPLIINFSMDYFLAESSQIELPLLKTIIQIMVLTVIPISRGMFVRHKKPVFANRMEKGVKIASSILFTLVFISIIVTNVETIKTYLPMLGAVTFSLNVLTMLVGFYLGKIGSLNLAQRISIMIESGIQNGTLAIVVASSILLKPDFALPAAIYSIFMFVSGGVIMYVFGREKEVMVN